MWCRGVRSASRRGAPEPWNRCRLVAAAGPLPPRKNAKLCFEERSSFPKVQSHIFVRATQLAMGPRGGGGFKGPCTRSLGNRRAEHATSPDPLRHGRRTGRTQDAGTSWERWMYAWRVLPHPTASE
eukprot:gene9600-biopygen18228